MPAGGSAAVRATPGIGHNGGGCPLCSGEGRDPDLVEQVAADLWESRRHGTLCDWPWDEAGEQWQHTYRGFAETAIASVKRRAGAMLVS